MDSYKSYSAGLKKQVVLDYLSGKGSQTDIVEVKILRREKEQAEMEASFLKTRRNREEAGLGLVRHEFIYQQSKKNIRNIFILSVHYAVSEVLQEPYTING